MARHAVITLAELPVKTSKVFKLAGQSVLLCHSTAGVFAVENRCSHQLATLEGGRLRGTYLFCPKHGERFDLRSGTPTGQLTKVPIKTFAVSVEDEQVVVELPDE